MFSKIGWFSVVLVSVAFLAYDAEANYIAQPRLLKLDTFSLTNDSCTGPDPFADPDNPSKYYQCWFIGEYYIMFYYECSPGGVYDAGSASCVEQIIDVTSTTLEPSTTEASTTKIMTTTEEQTTTLEPSTTPEITTTEEQTTTSEPSTTPEITTTEEQTTTLEPSTTPEITTTEEQQTTTLEPSTTPEITTTEEQQTTTPEITTTEEQQTTTLEPSTTITTQATTEEISSTTTQGTTEPPQRYFCSAEGLFPDPQDSSKYYRCVKIQGQYYYYVYSCPSSSCYDSVKQFCILNSCPATTTLSTSTLAPTTISTSTMNPTTISTLSPTSIAPTTPAVGVTCTEPGNMPDPSGDCTAYYKCALVGGVWYSYHFFCPVGSYYNESSALCTVGQCATTNPASTTLTTIVTTSVTDATTTTVTIITDSTTSPTIPSFPVYNCYSAGLFEDPNECTGYYRCVQSGNNWNVYIYRCPSGTYWSQSTPGCLIGPCASIMTNAPESSLSSSTSLITSTTSRPSTSTASPSTSTASPSTSTTSPSTSTSSPSTSTTSPSTSTTSPSTSTTSPSTSTTSPSTSTTSPSTSTTTSPSTSTTSPSTSTTSPSTLATAGLVEDATSETTTTVSTMTTPAPFICSSAGSFSNPLDCGSYFKCALVNGVYVKYPFTCPVGSYFSSTTARCVIGMCIGFVG